jgi:hypothetical protein
MEERMFLVDRIEYSVPYLCIMCNAALPLLLTNDPF